MEKDPDAPEQELSDIVQERSAPVQGAEEESALEQEAPAAGDASCPDVEEHETSEPRTFTVVRRADESGVSGTGRVLDGCIFHSGQVVICWRGDINSEQSGYSSLAIYPCWEAFQNVHIDAHPSNETEIMFGRKGGLMACLVERAAERAAEAGEDGEDGEADEAGEAAAA